MLSATSRRNENINSHGNTAVICTQVGLLPIQSAGLEVAGRQVNKNLFERSSLVLCKLKKEDEKKKHLSGRCGNYYSFHNNDNTDSHHRSNKSNGNNIRITYLTTIMIMVKIIITIHIVIT